MRRGTFSILCHLLQESGGLVSTRNCSVPEQVAQLLFILAHHTKNRIVREDYTRSGCTISRNFHRVLNAIIKLHPLLLSRPAPIDEQCTDNRWKHFKGCLGALDGTQYRVIVPRADQACYRNRKGKTTVNILMVCDINMNYIYVLTGWEGSANDSRVLRNALVRDPGFRVPAGNYYLCDGGYANREGFLAPYRGARYHLNEWRGGGRAPRNKEEYFNMKHAKARNVIERSFAVMKDRWAILQSNSFYPIKVHNRIIMTCALLHNFINYHQGLEPFDDEFPPQELDNDDNVAIEERDEATEQWRIWRDELATNMFNEWRE